MAAQRPSVSVSPQLALWLRNSTIERAESLQQTLILARRIGLDRSPDGLPEKHLLDVTTATVNALAKNGLKNCCLFGSMACYLYGMDSRKPRDIDMLVSDTNSLGAEEIKRRIVASNSNFYLVAPKNSRATYKVLWYRISERLSCKVDILIPGAGSSMRLPHIPSDKVVWHAGSGRSTSSSQSNRFKYPVMPLLPLILLKVQGWHDYREATQQYKRPGDKVGMYALDVEEILAIAVKRGSKICVHVRDCQGWIESSFLERTQTYVRKFHLSRGGSFNPLSKSRWEKLGLTV